MVAPLWDPKTAEVGPRRSCPWPDCACTELTIGNRADPKDDATTKGEVAAPSDQRRKRAAQPLISNRKNTMGLDLLPRPTGPDASELPPGMTHRKSEPCPYDSDHNPIGIYGTCCSFRGNAVALYLFAMGMGPLAVRLFSNMLPEEATEFADSLRAAVKAHRAKLEEVATKTKMPMDALLADATAKIPDVDWEFPIQKALLTIEAAAAWYEKTGRMLCGVRAWS